MDTLAKDIPPVLFAWVGEDELGSGVAGLKQALCPAGRIPLVSVNEARMKQAYLVSQMEAQVQVSHKPIKLCRYVFSEVLTVLKDDGAAGPMILPSDLSKLDAAIEVLLRHQHGLALLRDKSIAESLRTVRVVLDARRESDKDRAKQN